MAEVIDTDPGSVVARAGPWLEREPVLHNVICTVLARAIENPSTFGNARWFVVEDGGDPAGVAIATPPFPLTLTPMGTGLLHDLADALAARLPDLPGVHGPGDVARRFAGLWAERTGDEVERGMEQLMYQLEAVVPPPHSDGRLRPAEAADRQLLCEWVDAFGREAGAVSGDIAATVDHRLAHGGLYLWEHTAVATLVGVAPPVAGVVRVGPVYTPPELRRRGRPPLNTASASRPLRCRGPTASSWPCRPDPRLCPSGLPATP
jgi:hypothetical protein